MTEVVGLRHVECRKRAAECRHRADKTISTAARAFFLDAETHWLSVAASYELQEQKSGARAKVGEERRPFATP